MWTDAHPPGSFDGFIDSKARFAFAPEAQVPRMPYRSICFTRAALDIAATTAPSRPYKRNLRFATEGEGHFRDYS